MPAPGVAMKKWRRAIEKANAVFCSAGVQILAGLILVLPAVFYVLWMAEGYFRDAPIRINMSRGPQTTTGGGLCLTLAVLGAFMVYGGVRKAWPRSDRRGK